MMIFVIIKKLNFQYHLNLKGLTYFPFAYEVYFIFHSLLLILILKSLGIDNLKNKKLCFFLLF